MGTRGTSRHVPPLAGMSGLTTSIAASALLQSLILSPLTSGIRAGNVCHILSRLYTSNRYLPPAQAHEVLKMRTMLKPIGSFNRKIQNRVHVSKERTSHLLLATDCCFSILFCAAKE